MDTKKFIEGFQDYMAPTIDTYEQAIYLYLIRHTRLLGKEEECIGFKSAVRQMAFGVGEHGRPMAESTAYEKLRSLESKGYIRKIRTEHRGTVVGVFLPWEISDLIPANNQAIFVDIEDMDFSDVPENRNRILERENRCCFYTLKPLDNRNFVIDHVVPRSNGGGNGYRNVVASSLEANNRKGSMAADDFIRKLFREGFLNEEELEGRIKALEQLRNGELRPRMDV